MEIKLDLDRDRIKAVLKEAYEVCQDTLVASFDIGCDVFVSRIDPYLDCNRISTVVGLHLPSRKYPELVIEIDLRRKKIIARMTNDRVRTHLNRFLTKL